MRTGLLFVIFIKIFILVFAKTYIIIDEKYEFFTLGTEDPKYDLFDASNFEIIPENDTHTFLNGSLKVLVDITSPWFLHTHLEHLTQGKWLLQAFTKNISDFCPELKSPLQPWYYATKNLKGCPVPAGHVWELNMIPLELTEMLMKAIPSHYVGRWRAVINRKFMVDGTEMMDCARFYADVHVE